MERRGSARRLRALAAGALAAAVATLAACGQEKQDAHEPTGTWKLDVLSASFPGNQRLGQSTTLKIQVKNADSREVPNLAVTVDGLDQRRDDSTLSDPKRSIWIVNTPPENADSAYVNTWAIGPVPAGKIRTFTWKVTAIRAGTYSVRYRVGAGLNGKAKAEQPDGSAAKGSFIARVTRSPRPVTIGPGPQTEEQAQ